jgi:hypothetical protein
LSEKVKWKFSYRGENYEADLSVEFIRAVHEYDLSFLLERVQNPQDIDAFKFYFIATTTLKSVVYKATINPCLRPDGVWHVLMTYTPDYQDFCLRTWGRMLPHDPQMSLDQLTRMSARDAHRLGELLTQITEYDYSCLSGIVGTDHQQKNWELANSFEGSNLNDQFSGIVKK